MRDILVILIFLFILAFVFPSLIRLAGNFFELMVFGDMARSEFMSNFAEYSYGPTLDFYKSLLYKLTH